MNILFHIHVCTRNQGELKVSITAKAPMFCYCPYDMYNSIACISGIWLSFRGLAPKPWVDLPWFQESPAVGAAVFSKWANTWVRTIQYQPMLLLHRTDEVIGKVHYILLVSVVQSLKSEALVRIWINLNWNYSKWDLMRLSEYICIYLHVKENMWADWFFFSLVDAGNKQQIPYNEIYIHWEKWPSFSMHFHVQWIASDKWTLVGDHRSSQSLLFGDHTPLNVSMLGHCVCACGFIPKLRTLGQIDFIGRNQILSYDR